jgi:hypothetical protein
MMTLQRSVKCMNLYVIKVHMIQKSGQLFFVDIFTWSDGTRRALQNYLYKKNFKPFFPNKIFKK